MLITYQAGCCREPRQSRICGAWVPQHPFKVISFHRKMNLDTTANKSMRFYLFAVFGEGGRRQQEATAAFLMPGRGAKCEQSFFSAQGGYFRGRQHHSLGQRAHQSIYKSGRVQYKISLTLDASGEQPSPKSWGSKGTFQTLRAPVTTQQTVFECISQSCHTHSHEGAQS